MLDHLEPSEVEQQTTWLCVSIPGAALGLSASGTGWLWAAEGPGGSP